jgi:cytochrome P450
MIEALLKLRLKIDKATQRVMFAPWLTRPLFGFIRKHKPILVLGKKLAIVTKYTDVLQVFRSDQYFSTTQIYGPQIALTTGNFVVGMANTPEYKWYLDLMQKAARREDLGKVREFSSECAAGLVAEAAKECRIDAVGGLSRLASFRLLEHYFGVHATGNVTETQMMGWMRSIFQEIFANLSNDPLMRRQAIQDAQALLAHLDTLIAARKADMAANRPVPDDYLCRLLKMQNEEESPAFTLELVRRLVGGTIVGTTETNSSAIGQALDQLLDRPAELAAAQEAALKDDDELLTHYMYEALRFNPQAPILFRMCEREITLAQGTRRARTIKPGTKVVIALEAAMFDEDRFPNPETFRADRPLQDYLYYGNSLHVCFGRYISLVHIPAVAKQILRKKNLRRAPGSAGRLKRDGAFLDHLFLEFDSD